jgi:hypothetical protein
MKGRAPFVPHQISDARTDHQHHHRQHSNCDGRNQQSRLGMKFQMQHKPFSESTGLDLIE